MPKRTLFVVGRAKQAVFVELNADDLNNDLLKRTLFFVGGAKQRCFVGLNSDRHHLTSWYAAPSLAFATL